MKKFYAGILIGIALASAFSLGRTSGSLSIASKAHAGVLTAPVGGTINDPASEIYQNYLRLDGANSPGTRVTWDLSNVNVIFNAVTSVTAETKTMRLAPALTTDEENSLTTPGDDGTLYMKEGLSGTVFNHFENSESFEWDAIAGAVFDATGGLRAIVRSSTDAISSEWINSDEI